MIAYGQNNEDVVIEHFLQHIGDGGKVAVDFGAADGVWLSNTLALEQRGWRRFLFDGDNRGSPQVREVILTAENINEEFDKVGVPSVIDVLSIDVDGNDFWLWAALRRRARLVVIEFNAALPQGEAITIAYNPQHRWDNSSYYGASLYALYRLAQVKKMRLVRVESFNAYFIDEDEAETRGIPGVAPGHNPTYEMWGRIDSTRPWVRVEF